jgi:hypothetical protein
MFRRVAVLIAGASFVALPAMPAAASAPAASCVGQGAPIDAQNPDLHPLGLELLGPFTPGGVKGLVTPLAHSHDQCLAS